MCITMPLHSLLVFTHHIMPHICSLRPPAPQIITPFNVYYNAKLIFQKGEVWRLLTNFFFFGNLGER